MVGGDIEPTGLLVDARSSPFRTTVDAEEEVCTPFGARAEEAGCRALEPRENIIGRFLRARG